MLPSRASRLWCQVGSGVAAVGALWMTLSSSTSAMRIVAASSCVGALGAFITASTIKQSSRKLESQSSPTALKFDEYDVVWTTLDNQGNPQNHSARASALDLGDRILIRQPETPCGTYILDLKRHANDSVSGIWWFYGDKIPYGTYRGEIVGDGQIIKGSWQQPNGSWNGSWDFTATAHLDKANSSANEN